MTLLESSPFGEARGNGRSGPTAVRHMGRSHLPLDAGEFVAHAFDDDLGNTHLAITKGDLSTAVSPLVRLHSECLTGDALRSTRCDCGSQLQASLETIEATGVGAVIYVAGHEGRGIGLADKIRAYALQDEGADTVDANLLLGHDADERDFGAAAAILDWFGVTHLRLLSNNPAKATALTEQGITVDRIVGQPGTVTPENARYLTTKRDRMGHRFEVGGDVTGEHHVL